MDTANRRLSTIKQQLPSAPQEVVICAAFRSALTKSNRGGLRETPVEEILAQLFAHVLKATRLDSSKIEEVIIGNVLKVGSGGMSLRMAQFMADFAESVPCYTVNRMCASGLQSCSNVADAIRCGSIKIGLAGGVENMSIYSMNSAVHPPLPERGFLVEAGNNSLLPMGVTSDNVVEKFGVTRVKMDQLAVDSHARAAYAQDNGLFDTEIVPIKTTITENGTKKEILVSQDDGIRRSTSMQGLAKLRSAFKKNGGTTAGNASQTTDGGAVVLLASRKAAEEHNLPILARWVGFAAVGVPPEIMGIGPAIAIPKVLEKTGLTLQDIDLLEINEAFASQASYCVEKLGIDWGKVNVKGGAIALGHPLGCTGSRQIAALLPELKRRGGRFGVVSMCIGSGMGAAAVIESLS